MYKPILIEGSNLFSFLNLKYSINGGVTTSIRGENRDNDSQESNGSGKSALIEVFAIAITGGPIRKIKNEEIINDFADEAMAKIVLQNDALHEQIIITRKFFRKSSSIVSMQTFKDGEEIIDPLLNSESSVETYNKAILSRIGLTRDEIFNNFILSKYRYVNFLSVSDTKKKDIINQFSRGNFINQAIESLQEAYGPIKDEMNELSLALATENGKIDGLKAQLLIVVDSDALANNSIIEKIKSSHEAIASLRADIRKNNSKEKEIIELISQLNTVLDELDSDVEKCVDLPALEQIQVLIDGINKHNISFPNTFIDDINVIINSSDAYNLQIEKNAVDLLNANKRLSDEKAKYEKLLASPLADEKSVFLKSTAISEQCNTIAKSLDDAYSKLTIAKNYVETLRKEKSALSTKLMGEVTCPKCNHVFLPFDADFDVKSAEIDMKTLDKKIQESKVTIESNQDAVSVLESSVDKIKKEKAAHIESANTLKSNLSKVNNAILTLSTEIESIKHKTAILTDNVKGVDSKVDAFIVDAFNSVMDHIDVLIAQQTNIIAELKIKTSTMSGTISNHQERIAGFEDNKDMDNTIQINDSIKKIKIKRGEIEKSLSDVTHNYEKHIEQEQTFIDYKTSLANSKIATLGEITNSFLESIGSDLRVEFSGFTKVKNKTREKISIRLMRDGIDAGSFGKLSGGEQARISLANILALSQLININCDDGRGLDLLILDEILEAVDGTGLTNMLRTLNETGITCLVVSHGKVAENYEYNQVVVKENGESQIII